MTTATSATLSTHLAQFPDVLEQLTAAHEAAWVTVDPHILELCRLRIASMLGAEAEMAINTPQAALTTESAAHFRNGHSRRFSQSQKKLASLLPKNSSLMLQACKKRPPSALVNSWANKNLPTL
jgi:hypothetical protein